MFKTELKRQNSILNLNSQLNIDDYNIVGFSILKKKSDPVCNECTENERRVPLQFSDPTWPGVLQGLTAKVVLRRLPVMGTPKIKMILKQTSSLIPDVGTNPPPEQYRFNVPWGEYVLTKVE